MQSKTLRQVYKNAYEEAVLKYRLNPPAKTKQKKRQKTPKCWVCHLSFIWFQSLHEVNQIAEITS